MCFVRNDLTMTFDDLSFLSGFFLYYFVQQIRYTCLLLLIIIALCYNYPKKIKNLAFSNDLEIINSKEKKNDILEILLLSRNVSLLFYLLIKRKKNESLKVPDSLTITLKRSS